jgi:hypothetical protein
VKETTMIQSSVTWSSVISQRTGILSYTAAKTSTLVKRIRLVEQVERVEGKCIFYVKFDVLTVSVAEFLNFLLCYAVL